MKLVTILGARPQFVKAATVSRELKKAGIQEVIVHTGQHFDHNMSQVFFDEMEIPQPDYNLEINGLNHGAMTGRMLEKIEEVLIKEKPDNALVYGDTNSTLAGALAAVKLHIPVAHVEAGLRSFEMKMPEEVNRILTDRISSVLFCPTSTAITNLHQEGYDDFSCKVILSGDVMYDAVRYYRSKIDTHSTILQKEKLENTPFILVTLHRAENTNDPKRLKEICEALKEISREVRIVIPLHPRTKAFLEKQNIQLEATIIEPVGYFDMLALLQNCKMVMTDSGGLQKEAYFFEKFCITLRDQTEWVELVEAGANALAGADRKVILSLFKENYNKSFRLKEGLYGDGHAATVIAKHFV
ncbi:MAG: UDP-N-acetylglucosamine 2-epimerase (non-hydrolyzing) [Cyclobacteriaceae bacterium]